MTIAINLAKNIFAVHGVNESGKPELVRPEVPRAKLVELIANVPPCLIGIGKRAAARITGHANLPGSAIPCA